MFVAVIIATSAHAEENALRQGKWGDLTRHVGTYNYDAVLNDKRVNAQLRNILSIDDLAHLKRNLKVHIPIATRDSCIILEGLAPHGGGNEEALLYVCLYRQQVLAAILSHDEVQVFTSDPYSSLPKPFQAWVYGTKNRDVYKQPPYVVMRMPDVQK